MDQLDLNLSPAPSSSATSHCNCDNTARSSSCCRQIPPPPPKSRIRSRPTRQGSVSGSAVSVAAAASSSNCNDAQSSRPYECRFCPMKFTKSQALGGHMNRHRQEREREQLLHARRLVMEQDWPAAALMLSPLSDPQAVLASLVQGQHQKDNFFKTGHIHDGNSSSKVSSLLRESRGTKSTCMDAATEAEVELTLGAGNGLQRK